MKAKLYRFIGIASFLITMTAFSANAQEGGMPSNEIPDLNTHTENTIDEKPLLYDPEKSGTNSEKVVPGKDQSTSSKSGNKAKANEASKSTTAKEDDALSFNFLYYIIQKFKISDIVEQ